MTKVDSVVSLLKSMTKSEKKHFSVQIIRKNSKKDFIQIYELIEREGITDSSLLRERFKQKNGGSSFDIALQYLYDKLLNMLLGLRKGRDVCYDLYQDILKAKMLYERSMFHESFMLLEKTIVRAQKYENYMVLLLAARIELDYLQNLDFPYLTEKELCHKQYIITESLKILRKINEQSFLYELLKYRLIYRGRNRSEVQKKEMGDLMISELYIASSLSKSNFEITKIHQLFQANYLMSIGDYEAALNSFQELTVLFKTNVKLWENPPYYYLSTLEGVLGSLRSVANYEGIRHFLEELKGLTTQSFADFQINATCLLFQYELFLFLDKGDFESCIHLIDEYEITLYNKFESLNPIRQAELCLYTALVYLGNGNMKRARYFINKAILDRNLDYLPLSHTIRLVKLMIYYEQGDFDIIRYESRSLKRRFLMDEERYYQIERYMLSFLNKDSLPILLQTRQSMWNKLWEQLSALYQDSFEKQLLDLFDFIAWIEAKLLKKKLSKVLYEHFFKRSNLN